jgi:hypothetical protein
MSVTYSALEMEAALCVWECLCDWTTGAHSKINRDLVILGEKISTAELRHLAIPLGQYCLKVYDKLPPAVVDGHPYDWEVIPAILDTLDFSAPDQRPPLDAAVDKVIAALTAMDVPEARTEENAEATELDAEDEARETVRTEWGLACPSCNRDDKLMIDVSGFAWLSVDGTESTGNHEWDEKSFITCQGCAWEGTVAKARIADRNGKPRWPGSINGKTNKRKQHA